MEITGIILAGGKSTRMGSDKALLVIEDKTLLKRSVDLCKKFCSQIIISSNSINHEIEGIQRIADDVPDSGPIAGIYSCMKYSKNDWVFVLSVDSAFVDSAFVTFLIKNADESDAIIPQHKNGKEPLIGLYHKRIIPVMNKMIDNSEYKMHLLLDKIHSKHVDSNKWVDENPRLFHNINSPLDLEI